MREKFRRLAVRGVKKAVIAVAHAQLVLVYQVLSSGVPHQEADSGAVPDERRHQRMVRHHIRCLGRLGISAGPTLSNPTRSYRCNTRLQTDGKNGE